MTELYRKIANVLDICMIYSSSYMTIPISQSSVREISDPGFNWTHNTPGDIKRELIDIPSSFRTEAHKYKLFFEFRDCTGRNNIFRLIKKGENVLPFKRRDILNQYIDYDGEVIQVTDEYDDLKDKPIIRAYVKCEGTATDAMLCKSITTAIMSAMAVGKPEYINKLDKDQLKLLYALIEYIKAYDNIDSISTSIVNEIERLYAIKAKGKTEGLIEKIVRSYSSVIPNPEEIEWRINAITTKESGIAKEIEERRFTLDQLLKQKLELQKEARELGDVKGELKTHTYTLKLYLNKLGQVRVNDSSTELVIENDSYIEHWNLVDAKQRLYAVLSDITIADMIALAKIFVEKEGEYIYKVPVKTIFKIPTEAQHIDIISDSNAHTSYIQNGHRIMIQPHIMNYNCFGTARDIFRTAIKAGNYDGGINALLYACKQISFNDATVSERFLRELASGNSEGPFSILQMNKETREETMITYDDFKKQTAKEILEYLKSLAIPNMEEALYTSILTSNEIDIGGPLLELMLSAIPERPNNADLQDDNDYLMVTLSDEEREEKRTQLIETIQSEILSDVATPTARELVQNMELILEEDVTLHRLRTERINARRLRRRHANAQVPDTERIAEIDNQLNQINTQIEDRERFLRRENGINEEN